jgi:hypothetical protein
LIGLDNVRPFDARLLAQVWSWATNEPSRGESCAYQGGDGFFRSGNCAQHRRIACRAGAKWIVTGAKDAWWNAARQCAQRGAVFGVPANGWQNEQLKAAKRAGDVWLDYADRGQGFVPGASVRP